MKNITNFLHFRTVIIFAMLSYSLSNFSQGTAKRYVKEKVHTGTIEGITSIKYFDGLGRPCILATNGAADSAKYTYALQVYDEIGHVSENWLPGVCDVTATHDLPDVEAIKSWSIATNGNDTRPYSLTKYDALNNVKSVCGAGSNWSAKAVVTGYAANRAREVKLYRAPLTNNDLTQDGYYAESTLHAKTIKDEDGRTMTVFTDYNGHKILERRSDNNDTYYVYNDYGELRFVLSPKYQQNQSIEALAYEYRYDSRGRCVYKRIPGCDPVIYTYDGKGHIATMQDGILRKDGKVRFYMYDHLNRNVITGIGRNFNPEWTEVKKTSIGQGICGTIYVISNAGSGNSQPSGDFEIENVYYYDDYSFLPTFPESIFHEKLDEGNCLYRITGLQTAVSGDGIENTTYDYKTMYYDEWGNCKEEISTSTVWGKKQPVISPIHKEKQILATVQAQSLGISSGVIREMKKRYDIKTVEYSYSGKPKKITVRHFDSLNASNYNYSEEYEYHYNNVDKIKEITHRLTDNTTTQASSSPKISIAKYEYDDLGRIKTMSHNGRQKLKSTYTYNIRGWKTTCQNSLFSETLEYEQPSVSGAKSMYSGCISAVKWNSATHAQTQSYAYTYDKLNRLTMAIYATSSEGGNRYGEKAKYDQNGNITSFLRRGTTDDDTAGLIDDLSFSYNGNQLTDITDCAPHFPTYKDAFHYIDKDADGGEPGFEYDENGRMTRNSDRDICSIEYNYLNLPVKTTFTDGSTINNTYDAMGNRLSTVSLINSITASKPSAALIGGPTISPFIFTNETVTSYSGNLLYEGCVPSKLFFGTGYVDLKDNCKYYFYITDHLGSVRVVADGEGNAVQHNEYYAFGGLMSDMCVGADKQRYKFQGKELDRSHGLNWNFHGARFADLLTGSWTTADPLAEAFYNMSPYSFCNSNTAMFTDPNGMASWNPLDWYLSLTKGKIAHHYKLEEFIVYGRKPRWLLAVEEFNRYRSGEEANTYNYLHNDGDLVPWQGNGTLLMFNNGGTYVSPQGGTSGDVGNINSAFNSIGGALKNKAGNSVFAHEYFSNARIAWDDGKGNFLDPYYNEYTKNVKLSDVGRRISSATKIIGFGIDAYRVVDAYLQDGKKIGHNTVVTSAKVAGSWGGTWAGMKAFGIVGSRLGVQGAIICVAVGGIVGGIWGEDAISNIVDDIYYYF